MSVGGLVPVPRHPANPALVASSYTCGMEATSQLEDSRGVDVGQIRRQLSMSVPDRVRSMVETANRLLEIQEHAQASLRRSR